MVRFASDRVYIEYPVNGSLVPPFSVRPHCRQFTDQSSSAYSMRRPRRSSTLPKMAQTVGSSSHYLAAPDLFRLQPWRQLCPGSSCVENVCYSILGLALTTMTSSRRRNYSSLASFCPSVCPSLPSAYLP